MRISKDPEERKNELMDAAEELFLTAGYNETSVSDIVKKISVAQGTFYYYFKSKEDIFVSIFARSSERAVSEMQKEARDKDKNALQKLVAVIGIYVKSRKNKDKDKLVQALHYDENTGLHYKTIVQGIKQKEPVIEDIIKQGVDAGIFHTEYPRQAAELILTEFEFGLDPGVFEFNREQIIEKSKALISMIEKILVLPDGELYSIIKKHYMALI